MLSARNRIAVHSRFQSLRQEMVVVRVIDPCEAREQQFLEEQRGHQRSIGRPRCAIWDRLNPWHLYAGRRMAMPSAPVAIKILDLLLDSHSFTTRGDITPPRLETRRRPLELTGVPNAWPSGP
jgi:hypothetical protein